MHGCDVFLYLGRNGGIVTQSVLLPSTRRKSTRIIRPPGFSARYNDAIVLAGNSKWW